MNGKMMLKRMATVAGLMVLVLAALWNGRQEAAGRAADDRFVYMPLVVKSPPTLTLTVTGPSCGSNEWTVGWNDGGAGVTGYVLEEADDAAFGAPTVYSTTLTMQDFNYAPATDNLYYYRVRAEGSWGAGPWSETQPVVGGFLDEFANPASGWAVTDTAQSSTAYSGGTYQVSSKQEGYLIAARAPDVARDGYRAAVDVQWATGSATDGLYALVFGASGNLGKYYFLAVRPATQDYRVYFFDGSLPVADRLRPLTGWTVSAAVQGGAQVNHLEVIRVGDGIQAAINGTAVGSWADAAQTGATYAGVMVSANPAHPAVTASFDNFSLGTCGPTLAQSGPELARPATQPDTGVGVEAVDLGW
ncbi:MAG: fibronectin type III domain-containing protein [Ardenticatenaceae bacterium]|nr:fibronectin type III domain-containing protein [Ardenticatenaceae bacterium]